jgi:hypothetical protein
MYARASPTPHRRQSATGFRVAALTLAGINSQVLRRIPDEGGMNFPRLAGSCPPRAGNFVVGAQTIGARATVQLDAALRYYF